MNAIIISAIVYLVVLPLVVRLVAYAQRKLIVDKAHERNNAKKPAQQKDAESLPKPWWGSIKERLGFAFKDTRGFKFSKKSEASSMQNRVLFLILFLVGLIAMIAAPLSGVSALYAVGVIFFFVSLAFALLTPSEVLKARKNLVSRQAEVVESNGLGSTKRNHLPQHSVKVVEWADLTTPKKIEIPIPSKFREEGEENFMRHWNQIFGRITTWVPDYDKENKGGWDYEKGVLTIASVPPLPQVSPFKEEYVLHPAIAGGFFPIGIGISDGIELPDGEGGVINLIGFDVRGTQKGHGEKNGVKVSSKLGTATPQVLVAGSTGSGKAMSVNTSVIVKDEDEV